MVIETFYLSNDVGLERLMELTDLSYDEIERLVGRFPKSHHSWPGRLRGRVDIHHNKIRIRQRFGNNNIWEMEYDYGH